ncbi:MAG: branched-chain amino acid ABC transporter permease [Actinomycetota bacterium]|nr:branched-chain amino acid ABC transporter permease [Actinomycetota bacterium]
MSRALAPLGVALALLVVALPARATDAGPVLQGTLEVDDRPAAGVTIRVSTAGGDKVGSDTSDRVGEWAVALPGAGDYTVALDEATLPEGATVVTEPVLDDVEVGSGEQRTVLFPLTGEAGAGSALAEMLVSVTQATVDGVKLGLIIAMTAIGLSLIFGTTGLVNFAHGEMVTFGAVVAFLFNASGVFPHIQLVPATVLAIGAGALLGAGLERGLWRPLRGRGTGLISMLVVSIGLSLLLRHVILVLFGGSPRPYTDYTLQESLQLGPIALTPRDLATMALSVVVLVAVGLLLQRTRIGTAMRAVSDDVDLAESSGIDVQRVVLFVWMLGGGLAALGGVMLGASETVSWDMGFTLLLLMFAGVILGGLGTAYGAMAGSLVVGVVSQVSTLWFPPELKYMWALAVLIAVLLIRPQGIFGLRERVG